MVIFQGGYTVSVKLTKMDIKTLLVPSLFSKITMLLSKNILTIYFVGIVSSYKLCCNIYIVKESNLLSIW